MCTIIQGLRVDVSTIHAMAAQGWTVTPADIVPSYTRHQRAEDLIAEDCCLCAVDVEAVLDRNGVTYQPDPFGWVLTPSRTVTHAR